MSIYAKVHDPALTLPHLLSNASSHVATSQPDRQSLGLDIININDYETFDLIIAYSQWLMLTRSSSRDCKMPFVIGRGFADLQILSVHPRSVCEDFFPDSLCKNAHIGLYQFLFIAFLYI